MCKKCDARCIYFPDVDKQFEYTIDKKTRIKHKVNSKRYTCIFKDKKIKNNKKCNRYTTFEEMKKYRKELVQI